MRRLFLLAAAVMALGLAACGGGGTATKPPVATVHNVTLPGTSACSVGHMGCAAPRQRLSGVHLKAVRLPTNQGLLPDVYEGDSVYSWSTAKPHIVGAIVKAWESRQDAAFVRNWAALKALHIWHTAYIFQHSDCGQDVNYVNAVNAAGGFDSGPPVIDAEVSNAGPALSCAVGVIERMTHRTPIIYTAPGTWPGGFHDNAYLWAAGYGNYSHSPCVWTCAPIAWQYTDGIYGPYPHQIPGIQPGDISVSYGIQRLLPGPPPPPPDWYAILDRTVRSLGHGVRAAERNTVVTWDKNHCRHPARRLVCTSSRDHAALLAHRIDAVARGNYRPFYRRARREWLARVGEL